MPASNINTPVWDMYNRGYGDLTTARDAGIGDVRNALAQGRTDLTSYYNKGTGDIREFYGKGVEGVEDYYGKGRDDVVEYTEEGQGYYEPYVDAGRNALATLQAMLKEGVPGAEKVLEDPGFQFRLDQAEKAIQRSAAAENDLISGNTLRELGEYGSDYASSEYQKMIDRWYQSLTPYEKMAYDAGLTASAGSADLSKNAGNVLAQLADSAGGKLATLASTTGGQLGNLAGMTGQNLANIEMDAGGKIAGIRTDTAKSLADLGLNSSKTATSNLLAKEALGVDWGKLKLAELEPERQRKFAEETEMPFAERMADKGYNFYNDQASRNRTNNLLNSIMLGGGMLLS